MTLTIDDVRTAVTEALAARVDTPWLDTNGAASYLGVEAATMKTWRARGEGPRYRLCNRKLVRYHRDDLDAFVIGDAS
jgi:hypothetical protein